MLTWLAPIIVFGLVVFVHELGHFLAAKAVGVYAPRFSIGFGPALFRKRWGETEYVVAALPLGGYVRMASREDETIAELLEGGAERPAGQGEHGEDVEGGEPRTTGASGSPKMADERLREGMRPEEWDPEALAPFGPKPVPEHRLFESKGLLARLFILIAGVVMNFLLTLGVSIGSVAYFGDAYLAPVVDSVVAGMPAASAGLQGGDSVVAIDGVPVQRWSDVVERVIPATGDTLTLVVRRGGEEVTLRLSPEAAVDTNPATGEVRTLGRIGAAVNPESIVRVPVGAGEAVTRGWQGTINLGSMVFGTVRGLFKGTVAVSNLGGPIAIAQSSVEAARSGVETLLFLLAFISINVAILNLLPIPILDGGQILLNVAESVKGSPFSARTREHIMRLGIAAILLLFVVVMFNDVKRLLQSILG